MDAVFEEEVGDVDWINQSASLYLWNSGKYPRLKLRNMQLRQPNILNKISLAIEKLTVVGDVAVLEFVELVAAHYHFFDGHEGVEDVGIIHSND